MYRKVLVGLSFLFLSAGFASALTLDTLVDKAGEKWVKAEYGKNLYQIQKNANLRSAPQIKPSTKRGKSDGGEYVIYNCGANWCQIAPSGLWVHQSQIVVD